MLQKISQNKVSGGWHKQFQHDSRCLNCTMRFAIYLPPNASQQNRVPVLYWLSGLSCDEQNFMQKAGAFKLAAQLGIAIVTADTSPRGEGVPDDENGGYDMGLGAGFYVNAQRPPWQTHYQMYDYISAELPQLIAQHFPVSDKKSIAGHSMGGHGALVIGLRNPSAYHSISAFSPICNPINSPWGKKALTLYLGDNQQEWLPYDASELIKQGSILPILVDQGDSDPFLQTQLKPQSLVDAAQLKNVDLRLNMREGYDHSYFFISTFIDDHLKFHAHYLL